MAGQTKDYVVFEGGTGANKGDTFVSVDGVDFRVNDPVKVEDAKLRNELVQGSDRLKGLKFSLADGDDSGS